MDEILLYIQSNIAAAPYLILGIMLLAGFNIPVSEDLMLFICALLARENPDYAVILFFAVYLGAYISDLICFSLGFLFGPKLLKIKWFSNMISQNQIDKMSNFYQRYGIFTLVFGRFIPFGVRNALFLTAGLSRMNVVKFALSDLLACTISCASFFYLYYTYGESIISYVKKGNIVLFSIFLIVIFFVLIKKKYKKTPL